MHDLRPRRGVFIVHFLVWRMYRRVLDREGQAGHCICAYTDVPFLCPMKFRIFARISFLKVAFWGGAPSGNFRKGTIVETVLD